MIPVMSNALIITDYTDTLNKPRDPTLAVVNAEEFYSSKYKIDSQTLHASLHGIPILSARKFPVKWTILLKNWSSPNNLQSKIN